MLVIGGAECWVIWITDLSYPERDYTAASHKSDRVRICTGTASMQRFIWITSGSDITAGALSTAEPFVSKPTGSAYYGILANAIGRCNLACCGLWCWFELLVVLTE